MSKTYRISSKAGIVFGEYQGETPEAAFAAMVAECGDGVDNDGNSTAGSPSDWIIEAVETLTEAQAFIAAHGRDAADLMAALDPSGVPAEQDWQNEATTWAFDDGSRITISGPDVSVN